MGMFVKTWKKIFFREKKVPIFILIEWLVFTVVWTTSHDSPHLYSFVRTTFENALCQVWLELVQWFWRRKLLKVAIVILIIAIMLSLNGAWSLMRTSLNRLYQRLFWAKLSKNLISGSKKEKKNHEHFYNKDLCRQQTVDKMDQ